MLWFILSKLGLSYGIAGYGKLLASWPAYDSLFIKAALMKKVDKSLRRLICPSFPVLGWSMRSSWPEAGEPK